MPKKRILSKIGGSRKMSGRKIALNLRGLIFLPHIFLLKPGPVRDPPPRIFETILFFLGCVFTNESQPHCIAGSQFKTQNKVSANFDFGATDKERTGISAQAQSEERININTASAEELERLPGIGPALASRIVTHRNKHGRFNRPQDIIIVRGMSAKLYRRIARLIHTCRRSRRAGRLRRSRS
jgi:competence ComEA-like helix-hairpin-helix protein